jgi:hypothetical protein
MRPILRLSAALVLALGLGSAPANAALINFTVPLSGANEVPAGSGDPNGSGTAFLTFDDVENTVTWNIVTSNITLPIFLDHIHSGPAGVNGPVVIDFSAQLSGGPLFDADVAAVLANPSGFYVNVHTTDFTGGAIRGQIPEPGTAMLLGGGLLGFAIARRRTR